MARTWSSKSWIHKECLEWEKWHAILSRQNFGYEREEKKRRRRIPYPVKETGEDDLPICSIAQQRLAREGGTGFEQICSIELQTCFTLHSKYETTSISADRQTKIVVYVLIQRFDFHELCNHEISLNGRFIHRYRVYRISWNRREKNWLYRKLYIENT